MLLIGSHALINHTRDTDRQPRDIDLIGTFSDLSALTGRLRRQTDLRSIPLSQDKTVLKCGDGRIIEFEIAWEGTTGYDFLQSEQFFGICSEMPGGIGQVDIPVMDALYSLKMSHRFLKDSPHFRKTRDDIMLMRSLGAKIHDVEWFTRREKETYTYSHPKLNVMKGDFFKGDGIEYVYDHDSIHESMAQLSSNMGHYVPAYKFYMKDNAPVMCDKKKFFDLPERYRLAGVLEEAYVLALERSQIPFRGKVTPRKSFEMALMKVCTSITSGWFREFAWENFDKVEALYDDNYVARFDAGVLSGLVIRNTVERVTDENIGSLMEELKSL